MRYAFTTFHTYLLLFHAHLLLFMLIYYFSCFIYYFSCLSAGIDRCPRRSGCVRDWSPRVADWCSRRSIRVRDWSPRVADWCQWRSIRARAVGRARARLVSPPVNTRAPHWQRTRAIVVPALNAQGTDAKNPLYLQRFGAIGRSQGTHLGPLGEVSTRG